MCNKVWVPRSKFWLSIQLIVLNSEAIYRPNLYYLKQNLKMFLLFSIGHWLIKVSSKQRVLSKQVLTKNKDS